MLQLSWPFILLLLPLAAVVYFALPAAQDVKQSALRVPFMEDFQHLQTERMNQQGELWSKILLILIWLLLVLAAAKPIWVGERIELPVSGRDLMIAIDLSGSMQAEDFMINGRAVDRLTATKYVAQDFVRQRDGDRLGLILFGRTAYLQTPLTFDLATINTLMLESEIGLAGNETAIGDAIGLAIKRLKDKESGSRILILMTDGRNTAGEIEPLKAAELAASHGLKIYTIGIGADEQIRRSIFGTQRINPSQDLDEETLKAIASQTGGAYFRARDTEEFQKIYKTLDELEPVDVDSKSLRPEKALFMWPAGLALILGLLLMWFKFIRSGGR